MIDIDGLTRDELLVLNHRVIERIKFLEKAQAHVHMMAFNIGAQVSFESVEGRQFGRLVKYNQKTVNVDTEDGRRWRISPHLLTAVKDVTPEPKASLRQNRQRKKKRAKKSR
jgi:hypothetical protein